MASKVTFNAKKFIKNFDKYNPKSLRNAVYLTAEELGYFIARGGSTKDPSKKGLPYNFQQGKNKFRNPVDFTKNSVLYKPQKNKVEFYLYNKEAKGNAPSKYLYPVIGGGTTQAYPTRFVQYLRNKNYMRKDQYPVANLKNTTDIQLNASGNVKPTIYRNTIWGLSDTRKGKFKGKKRKGKGELIHQGRTFVVRYKGESKNKRLEAGIYRMVLDKNKEFVRPLFAFVKTPKIKPKESFGVQISAIAKRELPRFLRKNVNKAGKPY